MANAVVRPCSACGAPVTTYRYTDTPTCSDRCRKRLKRAESATQHTIKLGVFTIILTDLPSTTDKVALEQNFLANVLGPDLVETLQSMTLEQALSKIPSGELRIE